MFRKFVHLLRSLKRTPLLSRICFYSFCVSISLASLAVTLLGVMSYQEQKDRVNQCVNDALHHLMPIVSEQVWQKDVRSLSPHFDKIVSECSKSIEVELDQSYLSLELVNGNIIEFGQDELKGAVIKFKRSIHYVEPKVSNASTQRNEYLLGEYQFKISLALLYQHLASRTLYWILALTFIIGSGSMLALLLGQVMFVKRIREFTKNIQDGELSDSVRDAIQHEETELADLWRFTLDMTNSLEHRNQTLQNKLNEISHEMAQIKGMSDAKSQFLVKMSHELRMPMNGLLGFSALLNSTKLNDEQREYVQTIQVSLESLLHVINDVLDLSRIESGDLNVTSIPFSLRSVISGVSGLVRKRAESKGLRFECRISPEIPEMLKGDPVRIRQILLNLVSNAIEHTGDGYVLINVEPTNANVSQFGFRISIEDTGEEPEQRTKNIEASTASTAFSAELREKRSLGLDVCYQLANLMDSHIQYKTKQGEGNTYWFELNLPIAEQNSGSQSIDYSVINELNVLVIDSYELSREITIELLSSWGIRFQIATSVEMALEKLKHNDIHNGGINMVLCDDLLQDVAGIEVCQQIRKVTQKELRIIILSSNPQLGDAEGYYLVGANGFVSKRQRDPYLRPIMCQVYSERQATEGANKRLVTRYTISDTHDGDEYQLSEGHHGTVLVVEDNIVNQQLAARLLEKKGFTVDLASNGFEAIELFKANTYQLIFMDCLMPDMNGYETTQIIREIESSSSERTRTPIIALTAHAIEGEAERCFNVGMDEFVTKPFKLTKLEMVLERYIN